MCALKEKKEKETRVLRLLFCRSSEEEYIFLRTKRFSESFFIFKVYFICIYVMFIFQYPSRLFYEIG